MRVLFVTRPDVHRSPGGDTVQLLNTQQGLEQLGVEVRLGVASAEQIVWADLVHVFNAQTPEASLPALRLARQAGKKTVLSTIWWDLSHARLAERVGHLGLAVSPATRLLLPASRLTFRMLRTSWLRDVRETLQSADLLLPNSEEEMRVLEREFGDALPPYAVVLNAVDRQVFEWSRGLRPGVICFARLEAAKNQLNLIRAVPPGVDLTLVGRGHPESAYVKALMREADRRGVTVLNQHVSQTQVSNLMRLHSVHALPSLRESPGLSSLEALSAGLNAVVSNQSYCPTRTYFQELLGKHVFECDPYNLYTLRRSLEQALAAKAPGPDALAERFGWSEVARQTLEGYRRLTAHG